MCVILICDFPWTAGVCVWFSITTFGHICFSGCVRLVFKQEWQSDLYIKFVYKYVFFFENVGHTVHKLIMKKGIKSLKKIWDGKLFIMGDRNGFSYAPGKDYRIFLVTFTSSFCPTLTPCKHLQCTKKCRHLVLTAPALTLRSQIYLEPWTFYLMSKVKHSYEIYQLLICLKVSRSRNRIVEP